MTDTPAAAPERIDLSKEIERLLETYTATVERRAIDDAIGRKFEQAKANDLAENTARVALLTAMGAQPPVSAPVVPDELRALANAPGLASVDLFRSAAVRWVHSLLAAQPAPDAAPQPSPAAPVAAQASPVAWRVRDHHWHPDHSGLLRAVAAAQTVPEYETSPVYDAVFGEAVKVGEAERCR